MVSNNIGNESVSVDQSQFAIVNPVKNQPSLIQSFLVNINSVKITKNSLLLGKMLQSYISYSSCKRSDSSRAVTFNFRLIPLEKVWTPLSPS